MSCSVLYEVCYLKKFHKALRRTHQIKGQYELLCLKWLESELTTRQHFLHVGMSSLWLLSLYKLTEKDVGGHSLSPKF